MRDRIAVPLKKTLKVISDLKVKHCKQSTGRSGPVWQESCKQKSALYVGVVS